MFERDDIVIFLRVQQGCNLNCEHCFTLGNTDELSTTEFEHIDKFLTAIAKNVNPKSGVVYLHGGETFLAPLPYLKRVAAKVKEQFGDRLVIVPQTNLIYKITDDFIDFIKNDCSGHIGVSWDAKIRFGSIVSDSAYKQEQLFFKNLKTLIEADISVNINITVQKHLLDYDPEAIAKMFEGVVSIDFEHLSVFNDRTASLRANLVKWADWFDRLTTIYETRDVSWCLPQIDLFVNSIETGTTYQCKCNCCDRKTFTLNPNGTTGFCPDNSYISPVSNVLTASTDWTKFSEIAHDAHIARLSTLFTENCFSCEHFNECGGNCEDTLFDDSGECPLSKRTIQRIKDNKERFINLLKNRSMKKLLEFNKGKKK